MRVREFLELLATAWTRWLNGNSGSVAAAIAYNAVLSLTPLLLLMLMAAGELLGLETARAYLLDTVRQNLGADAVEAVRSLLDAAGENPAGLLGTVIGIGMMAHFSSAVFRELKVSFNQIWGVRTGITFKRALYEWLLSYLMVPAAVLATLIVLCFNLVASIATPVLSQWHSAGAQIGHLITGTFAFTLLVALLATIYKHVPDVRLEWSDVGGAALITAGIFQACQWLIGQAIARSLLVSIYGTAGAVIVILLWVWYGSQLLLFGAQFTRAYAEKHGSRRPKRNEAVE